jgi:hypothetical protein
VRGECPRISARKRINEILLNADDECSSEDNDGDKQRLHSAMSNNENPQRKNSGIAAPVEDEATEVSFQQPQPLNEQNHNHSSRTQILLEQQDDLSTQCGTALGNLQPNVNESNQDPPQQISTASPAGSISNSKQNDSNEFAPVRSVLKDLADYYDAEMNFAPVKINKEHQTQLSFCKDYYFVAGEEEANEELIEINRQLQMWSRRLTMHDVIIDATRAKLDEYDAKDDEEMGILYEGYSTEVISNYLYFEEYLNKQEGKLFRSSSSAKFFYVLWEPFEGAICIDRILNSEGDDTSHVSVIDKFCSYKTQYCVVPSSLNATEVTTQSMSHSAVPVLAIDEEAPEEGSSSLNDAAAMTQSMSHSRAAAVLTIDEEAAEDNLSPTFTTTQIRISKMLPEEAIAANQNTTVVNWLCIGFHPLNDRDYKRINQFVEANAGNVAVITSNLIRKSVLHDFSF